MLLTHPGVARRIERGWIPGVHRGIDYGWVESDPEGSQAVYAAAPGRVVSVYAGGGDNDGWGNRVIVEHAPGVRTTYNHLTTGRVAVYVGQWVDRGDYLGHQGMTGLSTGVHLHFELYLDGVRVDPWPYFTTDLPGTAPDPTPSPAGKTGTSREDDMLIVTSPAGKIFSIDTEYIRHETAPRAVELLAAMPGYSRVVCSGRDGELAWQALLASRGIPAELHDILSAGAGGGRWSGVDRVWQAPIRAQNADGTWAKGKDGGPVYYQASGYLASTNARV